MPKEIATFANIRSNISVLYVDDDQDLLDLGKIFLEKCGQFSVDIITSAPGALSLVPSKHYDAIISDYQMPGMNGIELLKEIRTSGNTIPFILFTGRGREEVVIQALNEGADFYLQKGGEPIPQFTELSHKIRQAVQRRRAEASIRDHERREQDIINFLPDATFAIDTKGIVIAWNRTIEEMTGIPAAQMLGNGDYEYALPFYGERRPILIDLILSPSAEIEKKYSGFIQDGSTLAAETTFPHLRGEQRTLWGKASLLFDRGGNVVGAIESIRDITEQKTAEDALKTSQGILREAMDLAHLANWEYDGTTRRFTFDDRFYALYGTTAAREGGYQMPADVYFREFVHPDDLDRIIWENEKKNKTASDSNHVLQKEHRIIRRDGKVRHIVVRSERIANKDGHVIKVRGVNQDITERKAAETELKQSEEMYRILVGHIQDGAFLIQDNILLLCNEVAASMLGYTQAEIMGLPIHNIIAPECREMSLERQRNWLTGKSLQESYELRLLHKDKTTRVPVINSVGICTYKNRPAFVGTIRNIVTECEPEPVLWEYEDVYRTLVETSFDGMVIHQDGVIIYANTTALKIMGVDSLDEAIGKPMISFVHPDYRNIVLQRAASGWKKEQPIIREKFVRVDGRVIDVDVVTRPVVWKNKPANHVMFRDITERKLTEDALALANKKLIMLGSITRHDILNQLMGLRGWLELSKEKVKDPVILEYILKEERAVKNIQEQIEFTRNYQELGGQAPKWQVLSDTIRSAVSQLNPQGTDIDIAFSHVEVFADPILEKVFYNLMENSFRHGGHVTRMGFSVQESEEGLTLTFCDNGAGISDEEKKKLFQKGLGKHTGLGLFLSREILSITGMTIRESGVQGKGARFEITVPKGAYRLNNM